jgi:uncharacterized protein (DUF488 family)
MNDLLTIGYEGSSIDDFIETLKVAKIEVLLDIRDLPLSRKRGFSKKALSAAVELAGLRYVHLKELGDPKPGREAARRGDTKAFKKIFGEHLKRENSQSALVDALEIASNSRTCLFCFERDHSGCHRTIVAEAMAGKKPLKVFHLGVRSGLANNGGKLNGKTIGAYAFG